jgi:hypothetical protein
MPQQLTIYSLSVHYTLHLQQCEQLSTLLQNSSFQSFMNRVEPVVAQSVWWLGFVMDKREIEIKYPERTKRRDLSLDPTDLPIQ